MRALRDTIVFILPHLIFFSRRLSIVQWVQVNLFWFWHCKFSTGSIGAGVTGQTRGCVIVYTLSLSLPFTSREVNAPIRLHKVRGQRLHVTRLMLCEDGHSFHLSRTLRKNDVSENFMAVTLRRCDRARFGNRLDVVDSIDQIQSLYCRRFDR